MRTPTCIYKQKELPCPMTTEEFAAASQEMIDWMNAKSEMEGKIEEIKSTYKAPIKDAEEKIDDLRIKCNTKSTSRKVEVCRIYDWDKGVTYERRMDTGEVVPGSFRRITQEDAACQATTDDVPAPSNLLLDVEEKDNVLCLAGPEQPETAEYEEINEDSDKEPDDSN